MLFSIIKLMMIKALSKIPLIKSLVKLRVKQVDIVDSVEQCERIAIKFEKSCTCMPVLGLDCEWVTQNGIRHPVALLQIADSDGMCSLIRLSKLKTIPPSLSNILSNSDIIKVGVAISDDAGLLMNDYNIHISGYIDLRYLAKECCLKERSLAALAYKLLGCELDKDWRIRASDWEAELLSDQQTEYAALDAYVAVEILKQLRNKEISWWNWLFLTDKQQWDNFIVKYLKYKDRSYKNKRNNGNANFKSKPTVRSYSTSTRKRTKIYDNCVIENVDGTVVSTCSNKKIDWYITQGLAKLVNGNPKTIRLNFPANIKRPNDNFSVLPRENSCVICGNCECFHKKSVIPKEFSQYLPTEYKSHISHDILLICHSCFMKSNAFDLMLRKKLYNKCQINEIKPHDYRMNSTYLKIIRSKNIAKILLNRRDRLSDNTIKQFKLEIAVTYNIKPDRVFDTFLETLLTIKYLKYENYKEHSSAPEKVVKYFLEQNAISELKAICRQHFLDAMKPKHLPHLWSVTYEG